MIAPFELLVSNATAMKPPFLFVVTFLACLAAVAQAQAHLFTDDQGRQVEAELAGIRGKHVILATQQVRALWPLAKLSAADQDYVREWQKTSTAVQRVTVQTFERDGIGERGEFKKEKGGMPGPGGDSPPKLPIGPQAETRTSYKHYELSIANPGALDASFLKVAYVMYVVQPDGRVGISPGVQNLTSLPAGKAASLTTEGVSVARTKTTQMKLQISSNSVSTREKTSRSQERFGGIWVRVSGPDGKRVGEARKLTPELEKLDPPWEEAEVQEDLPVLNSLSDLLELVKKMLPAAPPAPGKGKAKSKDGPPGPPPGLPPFPK